MSEITYKNGELYVESVPVSRIATAVGTPFYCYSSAALVGAYREFAGALSGLNTLVCFALKANSNLAVVQTFAAEGAGADVVSEGELRRALAAGIPPNRIVFSGVGKTEAELALALDSGILQINVESEAELRALSRLAAARRQKAPIAIRVNPDVDAGTHAKITTGRKENKFGIDITVAALVYAEAARLPGLDVSGIAVHIGSQIIDLSPYKAAFSRVKALALDLIARGHDIRRLDLGGGLGIAYDREVPPAASAYAAIVRETLGDLPCQLVFEPGRRLVGAAGLLATRVIYIKESGARRFLIVDAAMNDLLRPSLYDAHHPVWPVREPTAGTGLAEADLVGPVCESADVLAKGRLLPPMGEGELLALGAAGAYGAAMSSTYNSRPLVPEVLVRNDVFAVVRRRPDYAEMFALESLPPWLSEPRARQSRRAL
ncbi:MAG: diaminopimelate decarboxylase [Rhodospirillaceae bacterium]|nr:diaminopimelate decarboxylase [Rhodospirillaceae bacterium]